MGTSHELYLGERLSGPRLVLLQWSRLEQFGLQRRTWLARRCRVDRPDPSLRRADDFLANRARLSAREGAGGNDAEGLLLFGQSLPIGRARRHAHRRSGSFFEERA